MSVRASADRLVQIRGRPRAVQIAQQAEQGRVGGTEPQRLASRGDGAFEIIGLPARVAQLLVDVGVLRIRGRGPPEQGRGLVGGPPGRAERRLVHESRGVSGRLDMRQQARWLESLDRVDQHRLVDGHQLPIEVLTVRHDPRRERHAGRDQREVGDDARHGGDRRVQTAGLDGDPGCIQHALRGRRRVLHEVRVLNHDAAAIRVRQPFVPEPAEVRALPAEPHPELVGIVGTRPTLETCHVLAVREHGHDRIPVLNDVGHGGQVGRNHEVEVVVLLDGDPGGLAARARHRAAALDRRVVLAVEARVAERAPENRDEVVMAGSRDRDAQDSMR